jgi:membrane associated rhomboid family serine protease
MCGLEFGMTTSWRDTQGLPRKNLEGWSIHVRNQEVGKTFEEIERYAKIWSPASTVLIGSPGALHYLPPIFVVDIAKDALWSARKGSRNAVVVAALMLLIFGAASLVSARASSAALVALFLVVALWVDYRCLNSKLENIQERSLFIWHMRAPRKARVFALVCLFLGLAMGFIQCYSIQFRGGMEASFKLYGLEFELFESGEYWRILTGSFLHYSFAHYLVNFVLLLISASLAFSLIKWWSFLIFFIFSTFAAFTQWALGGNDLPSFGGISGGVYGLLGFVVACGVVRPILLPAGLAVLVANSSVLGIAGAWLMSAHAANAAHLGGLAVGALGGVLFAYFLRP